MTVFGEGYARAYDTLYGDKDYGAECDAILRFAPVAQGSSFLDLGCGTGGHAWHLARRGYRVLGVDRSDQAVARARTKAPSADAAARATFHVGDVQSFRAGEQFDVAIMMFAVLGYQTSNAEVLAALGTARAHLAPGGMFLFDVWHGPAVLTQRPSERVKVVDHGGGRLIRAARGELDVLRNVCRVDYRLWDLTPQGVVETEEAHTMRYFFAPELALLLDSAGFELAALTAFPETERAANPDDWNILVAARARP